MSEFINQKFDIVSKNFIKLKELSPLIDKIGEECIETLKSGHKIMFCGNGGSAADAQHLAAELVGKYKMKRRAFSAIALTTDSSILTSISNDNGYETVFERQIEGLGKAGDLLFGISTSGNSKNVIRAIKKAKEIGIKTIGMTGQNESLISQNADYTIKAPSDITNNIQEMHIAIGHVICEIVETALA